MEVLREVSAHTAAFESVLSHIHQTVSAEHSICLLFVGGSAEARQQALGRMKEATHLPLHQVNLDTLFDERPMAAQGNLREVFDTAGETVSILYFDNADTFLRHERRQSVREGLDPDALTPVTYLFDRIEAFPGAVVLCLSNSAYVAEARPYADVVVTF